jgi:hypothetical protein
MTEWKNIPGYEGDYQVSKKGDVRSLPRKVLHRYGGQRMFPGKVLCQRKDHKGYWMVTLWRNGKYVNAMTHRLVALAFLPNPKNKPEVNHKDGDKGNRRLSNLEWVTPEENRVHAMANGLYRRGESHQTSKLTRLQAEDIKYGDDRVTDAARKHGVSPSTVCGIRNGQTWGHI